MWSIVTDTDHCYLKIQDTGHPGFDIVIEAGPEEIVISARGWHEHYPLTGSVNDLVADTLGMVRDLLSPVMRIREELSNGSPFRWHLENQMDGKWIIESTTGLLFYPWLGRKTERIFMNQALPIRENHMI